MDAVTQRSILRVGRDGVRATRDVVVCEAPLQIRLAWTEGGQPRQTSLTITMRTPGDDVDLALGVLRTEGIVHTLDAVTDVAPCGAPADGTAANAVRVQLADGVSVDTRHLERHGTTTSACGVCGKTSLDAIVVPVARPLPTGPRLTPERVHALPGRLARAQAVFATTGGLHAAALFDADGTLLLAREDVGRHNAVDKLVGAALRAGVAPDGGLTLLVSGRASFELVQKAVVAGWPVLAAVGAPSSFAIDLAERHGMTLLGFVRDGGFNVYAGAHRLVLPTPPAEVAIPVTDRAEA
ncbi:MAG: formate dehydrogenase accessory sulfurtransferase FdhD [Alphaproteobacteria bacterium]|nr:formate dehydrogenase accessory sulfurtransferase FdhD [Alphaproteobacteria bacterium]